MERFSPSYFMIIPTMACQASCKYCFAKKYGDIMGVATLDAALDFIERIAPPEDKLQIVFHGGEPLLAGVAFYEYALPHIKRRFGARLRLSIQSNLWALNGSEGDRLTELLLLYNVSVGTSLDGPREMCDSQRGAGYYDKTTAAIEKLRQHGISVGKICTFGKYHADQAGRVFAEAEGPYSIHGAIPTLGDVCCSDETSMTVNVEQMTRILFDSYEAYRKDSAHARVSSVDSMARACFKGEGGLCTFKHCLGHFAAIAPDGTVYSCQRFNGCDGFSLGSVNDGLTEDEILNSPAYHRLKSKQDGMKSACGECAHFQYCKGGCLYSAFAGNTDKDPYCEAYKAVFDRLKIDMALEMAGELKKKLGVLSASAQDAPSTPILSMVGDKPHPYDGRTNRERFSNALLASGQPGDSFAAIKTLKRESFITYCMNRLGTMYLNPTYRCPLRCTHCSADAGNARMEELSAKRFVEIVREATELGFQKIEFAGGEIFAYPGFDDFMKGLSEIDRKGTEFIYRTSFGFSIPKERIETVCRLFDTVIVSIDGDEEYNDRRRGKGVYQKSVDNLKTAIALEGRRCKFGLCAVLTNEERRGKEGEAVRRLASDFGIKTLIYKSILPLGRGCGEPLDSFQCVEAKISSRFYPHYSCGIGHNLTVDPNGDVYPCYAWCEKSKLLGNLGTETIETILLRGDLFDYRLCGADTNEKCRHCDVRYLCGGMCKAWVHDKLNFDSGDFVCNKYEFYKRMAALV